MCLDSTTLVFPLIRLNNKNAVIASGGKFRAYGDKGQVR